MNIITDIKHSLGAAVNTWKTRPSALSREQIYRSAMQQGYQTGLKIAGDRRARLPGPGDARDGLTVTVPIYALNQVGEERCEWLVPGMLKDKVLALVKTLHQRPRSRLVPLPEFAADFVATTPFADGSLMDALLKAVR